MDAFKARIALILLAATAWWAVPARAAGPAPVTWEAPPLPFGETELLAVEGAAGLLTLPPGAPDRRGPAVLVLHDALGADGQVALYADQLLGVGIAVLDLLVNEENGATAALAALAAHPQVVAGSVGVLGFGAGARLAASLPGPLAARALLYPGCDTLPALSLPGQAVLLLHGEADASNPPEACDRAAARLAGAAVRRRGYPRAGYAWDYPGYPNEGSHLLPVADGSGRIRVQPWPDLAAQSAAEVAGFFATTLPERRR